MSKKGYKVDDEVLFRGFTGDDEDMPDNAELLKEGNTYHILSVDEGDDDDETCYNLAVLNPDHEPNKRKTKNNKEFITVEVYGDEIKAVKGDGAAYGKPTATESDVITDAVDVEDVVDAMEVGGTYTIIDDDGVEVIGKVTKLLKSSVDVEVMGEESTVRIKRKDIQRVEDAEPQVGIEDLTVGDDVTILDDGGVETTGKIVKLLKASLDIDDGNEEGALRLTHKEIVSITTYKSEEPEPEPKVEDKPTPKDKTKGKVKGKKKGKDGEKKGNKDKPKKDTKSKDKDKEGSEEEVDHKGIIILTEDEEDEEILALVNGTDDLCELAEEIAEEAANSDYKLGGILYHVYVTKAYKELNDEYSGKKGFALYTERELGVHYRKAMHLVKIYAKWNKYGLTSDDLGAVGWTKAIDIANVMDEDNAEDLIELAKKSTVVDLKATIKESYVEKGGTPGKIVKRITFQFRLEEKTANITKGYLEAGMEMLGMTNENEAFEYIMAEWAAQNLNVKPAKEEKGKGKKNK